MSFLQRAEIEGGWWHLDAASQNGKTTANKHYRDQRGPEKSPDGTTVVRVAMTVAADREHLIVAGLANSIGGAGLMRQPQKSIAVARAIARVQTSLVIVSNGHFMSWPDWQALLTLEELWKAYGVDPAVVFSSIHGNIGLATIRGSDGTMEQLRKRVRYEHVPGHDQREVREALQLLLETSGPELLGRGILEQSDLAFELLVAGTSAGMEKKVVTVDVIELARRMVAVGSRRPTAKAEDIIREAHTHLAVSRHEPLRGTG